MLGPWLETTDEAVADAVRAKQARWEGNDGGWHWMVPGAIEEGHGEISQEPAAGGGDEAPADSSRTRQRADSG